MLCTGRLFYFGSSKEDLLEITGFFNLDISEVPKLQTVNLATSSPIDLN